MPKTFKQNLLFTAMMSFLMVYVAKDKIKM